MENNYNNNIINQQQFTNQPINTEKKNNKKILFIIGAIMILLAIISIIVVALINTNSSDSEIQDEDDDEYTSIIRNDTPLLQIYSTLDETMTISDLEHIVEEKPDVQVHVYNDGTGKLSLNDSNDYIAFYYEWTEDENTQDTVEFETIEIQDYDKLLPIYNIQYIYEPENIEDTGLSISFSEEDNKYYVDVLYEIFEFDTKQEAVEAYLSK